MNQTKFFFEELKSDYRISGSDYSMKTGKMDKKLVLEFFLMRLNHIDDDKKFMYLVHELFVYKTIQMDRFKRLTRLLVSLRDFDEMQRFGG